MAFIRSYSRRAQMDYAAAVGDPGLGRFFKKVGRGVGRGVRKVGKGALGLARIAAPFVPGVGNLAAGLLGRLSSIGSRYGITGEQVASILASRGIDLTAYGDMGDVWDIGDPGGRTPKRKRAASGGKAKSQSKKERKASRAGKISSGRAPSGVKKGVDLGKIAASTTSLLPVGRDLADTILQEFGAPGFKKPGAAAGGFGGKRRTMNPGNTKALRRSLRRVDSFAKLARKVQKDAAGILRHVDRAPRVSAGRGRGHKAGCGCVVCRRAA